MRSLAKKIITNLSVLIGNSKCKTFETFYPINPSARLCKHLHNYYLHRMTDNYNYLRFTNDVQILRRYHFIFYRIMEQHRIKYQQINWTFSNIKAKASASNAVCRWTGHCTDYKHDSTKFYVNWSGQTLSLYRIDKKWFATQHLTQVKGCVRIQFQKGSSPTCVDICVRVRVRRTYRIRRKNVPWSLQPFAQRGCY